MSHADIRAAADLLVSERREIAARQDEAALAERLYTWYLNPTPLPRESGHLLPYELDLAAALRAAHVDAVRFEGGWKARTVSTWGRVVAEKGPLKRYMQRGEYTVPRRPGLRPRPNDALVAARFWAWIDEDTGFWHARHGVWPPRGADRLVRLYWNVSPREGPALVALLSRVLADSSVESSMIKTPASREHGGRADAFVLYLGPRDFTALREELRKATALLSRKLRPATPRFALPLAPGVALAEGKLEGDSFGETRCRLLARAFFSGPAENRSKAEMLAERIGELFLAEGLDPQRPYLERGATGDYGL